MSSKSFDNFKEFLGNIGEETTSADIATVSSKLGMVRSKHLHKGKKCKIHKTLNCDICHHDNRYEE